jgi:hypothetical protein
MDIRKKIEEAGIDNCMFLVPMRPLNVVFGCIAFTSDSDPEVIVPAKICEDKYTVKDNYKITLKSLYERFGQEHYYVSDLENLIDEGTIEFFVKS